MSKRTLLEMVQDIMNDISGDFVNSIDDTEESMQIAQIVMSTYFAMMSNRNWEHLKRTVALNSYGDITRPTHMKFVEDIKELVSLNYNARKLTDTTDKYLPIKYYSPDMFLMRSNQLNSGASNVETITDPSGITIFIRNDKAPEYVTSFDDNTLVFDSYDSGVETTLQESKFQAIAYMMPSWTHADSFIPELPAEGFSGLIEEAKSKTSYSLRQVANQKAEQEATRQRNWMSRKNWQIGGGIKYPDYGRKSRK